MKIKRKIIVIITISILLFAFLSYTYFSDASAVSNINITIKKTSVEEISLTYSKLKITIDINNPSQRDISIQKANFKIYISEVYIGDGIVSNINVLAESNKEKDVAITIYYANVANAVVEAITKFEFVLSIEGKADVNILFGMFTFSEKFEASREFP
jgi:LEA14-like dessication related protein